MQVHIQSMGFPLTAALSAYARKRIDFKLGFALDRVSRLMVRFSDINGSRGGKDKCCLLELRVKGASDIVVEDVKDDLYVAIDRAVERARRALVRTLGVKRKVTRLQPIEVDEAI